MFDLSGYPWTPPPPNCPDATLTRLTPKMDPRLRRHFICRLLQAKLRRHGTKRTSSRRATPRGDPRGVPKLLLFTRLITRAQSHLQDSSGRLEGFGAEEDLRRLFRALFKMDNTEDLFPWLQGRFFLFF